MTDVVKEAMVKDRLSAESIREALHTKTIGSNILYYPTVSSTMDIAKQAAKDGAAEGTVIIADHQTAGRGRLNREWLAPPGSSLLLSIILHPEPEIITRLTMVACLAVAQSIEKVTDLKPAIKWPNDVLINGRKVSGILSEANISSDSVSYAIVGIALNVNLDVATIPEIAETATSLRMELGRKVSRQKVLVALLNEFDSLYAALRRGEPIHLQWRQRLETLGRRVTVRCGDEVQQGYAEDVDEDGNLLLRHDDGSMSTIAAGDVTLRE
jgi:BirA family biotin operon repressor/biotin-[acetyl-CoA-carboxylase] ligase